MSQVYVQFSDAAEKTVIAGFSCPQDPSVWRNQGAIDSSDARYQAFTNPASTLAGAQAAQSALIDASYLNAVTQSVSYTSKGGVTKTYQADSASQTVLMQATQGYNLAGAVPSGFYWISADNTQVPFTLADLSGLYQAMLAQGWTAFQRKQALKAQINAAATVSAVTAITW